MTPKKKPMEMSSFQKACLAAYRAEDKKSLNTTILHSEKVSSLADYFVICSGETPAQIKAIAESIQDTLVKQGQKLLGYERDLSARWFLLDFGDVIVHIFHEQERAVYKLEDFWSHASIIPAHQWLPDGEFFQEAS